MGEAGGDALRVGLDGTVKLGLHGATISSGIGLFAHRDLDDAVRLTKRRDMASRPPSWSRTRSVTVDSGEKQATGTWVFGGLHSCSECSAVEPCEGQVGYVGVRRTDDKSEPKP